MFPAADDHVVRTGGAVDEIPLPQRPFLAFDDQERLACEHEEILLIGLPVVHGHRLAGPETGQVDPKLREVRLITLEALELRADTATFAVPPRRLARIEDEPALSCGDEPVLGRLEWRFGNHRRETAIPAADVSRAHSESASRSNRRTSMYVCFRTVRTTRPDPRSTTSIRTPLPVWSEA